MKQIISIVLVSLFLVSCSVAAFAQEESKSRLITVNGSAEVSAMPDVVDLCLSVENMDRDVNAAKKQNDERLKNILSLTKEFKIDPTDIQTSQINIRPKYKSQDETFLGYSVSRSLVITLKDIGQFETFLTRVLGAGVTNVSNVEFRVIDVRQYRDEARLMAIRAGREKAAAIAKELGEELGRVKTVEEAPAETWWGGTNFYLNRVSNEARSMVESEGPAAIGKISVRVLVKISFELK